MDQRINEAIILAGGLGTRLRSEIGEFPKPLAPINGEPFLTYLFEYLISHEIEHTYLSVGYKWEMIEEKYGTGYKSISIDYVVENEPLGTGGGIRLALNEIKGNETFVLNGDTLFEIDLHQLADFKRKCNSSCAIALKRLTNVDRYGSVRTEADKIIQFQEKAAHAETLINGGIYCLDKSILNAFALGSKFSFEQDFLEKDTPEKELVGLECNDYFIDIGIPEDYHKFEEKTR